MNSLSETDCRNTQYGCCEDGVTPAKGDNSAGCTDLKALAGKLHVDAFSCVDVHKMFMYYSQHESLLDICKQPSDTGSCSNYSVTWYYDLSSGTCRRFWYGGCEGNTNRFSSRDHCESVCVRPPGLGK